MGLEAEDVRGQTEFLIQYLRIGEDVPEWMNGEKRSREEVDKLSPTQQIGHSISREINEKLGDTIKCGTLEWRRLVIQRLNEVLADLSWLS